MSTDGIHAVLISKYSGAIILVTPIGLLLGCVQYSHEGLTQGCPGFEKAVLQCWNQHPFSSPARQNEGILTIWRVLAIHKKAYTPLPMCCPTGKHASHYIIINWQVKMII